LNIARTVSLSAVVALAGLAGGLATGTAHADWLVTRDGARIETKGAWKVDGRRVLFTMPNGTLSTLRTDAVDLDQSALATTQAREAAIAPPAAVKEKKEPVLRLTEKDIPPMGGTADEAEGKPGEAKGDAKDAVTPALDVISWEKTENGTGDGLEIFGTLKNNSANIITTPTVLVAIYDADGGLLATNSGEVNSPQIQPGKTANFRVAFPGVPDFASVKFDAQGRGYKPRVENPEGDPTEAPEYEEPSEMPAQEEAPAEEPPPL
jgi:uncharacterized protein YjbJ (UPF0337 family)